jgi:hypothetical protein
MITLESGALAQIPGLIRCEEYSREEMGDRLTELTHTVYPHDQVYGDYCTVHAYIDCPCADVFTYMSNPYSLLEWTYSVRRLTPAGADLFVGEDGEGTAIYCRTVADRRALTVDYHCAWDQGDDLWMVYLNRIVSAELVLKRPGSVVLWTNCRHPYYAANPFPRLAPSRPRTWVGDLWPLFYAGHTIELNNLKTILEHRHRHGLPIGPALSAAVTERP